MPRGSLTSEMAQANLCRLCVTICKDFKSLYDDNSHCNKIYDITVKYFHPMFLNVEKGTASTVICAECWRQISSFHTFQQSVILAQTKLLEDEKQLNANSEITCRPQEECIVRPSNEIGIAITDNVNANTTVINDSSEIPKPSVEIPNTTNALEDEEDSISLPDLELMDVYRDIKLDSDDDIISLSDVAVDDINHNRVEAKTEDIKANIYSTDVSSDAISMSSNDDTYSEEFEEPVGVFIGGDFNPSDGNTHMNTYRSEYETIDVQCSSDDEERYECAVKSIESVIDISTAENGSRNVETVNMTPLTESVANEDIVVTKNDCQNIQPMNTTSLTESFAESYNEATTNETIADIVNDSINNGTISRNDNSNQSVTACKKIRRKRNKSKSRSNLDCVICSQSFLSFELLQEHFLQQHPKEECYIVCCQRKLTDAFQVDKHMKAHNVSQNNSTRRKPKELDVIIAQWRPSLECAECKASCPSFTLLQEHFHQHHPTIQCYIECCKQKHRKRRAIEDHILYHKDKNIFNCKLCEKCHTSRPQLYRHMVYRHPESKHNVSQDDDNVLQTTDPSEKPRLIVTTIKRRRTSKESDEAIAEWRPILECVLCKEECLSFTLLQQHFHRNHPNMEVYILCCQRKLKLRCQIEEHIRYHRNPELFKCKLCGRGHINNVQLKRHMNYRHPGTTTGDRNISLNQSHFSDSTKTQKTDSKRKKSRPDSENSKVQWESNLECVVCHELYSSFPLLEEHFRQKHPNEECQVLQCRFKLTRRNEIKQNIPQDPPKADTSNNTLRSRISSKELDEFIAHYQPNLKCGVCSEHCSSFTLLQDHFREKHANRDCYILCCQRRFKLRSTVAEHISLHIDPQIFECKVCGKFHVSKNQLFCHVQHQHPTSKLCSSLDEDLKGDISENKAIARRTYKELDDFIVQHKSYLVCPLCTGTPLNFMQLEEHFRREHPHDKIYTLCCDRKLKNRHEIEEHLLLHIDANAFNCKVCSEPCTSRVSLYAHKLSQHPLATDGTNASVKGPAYCNLLKTCTRKFMMKSRAEKKKKRLDKIIARRKPILECAVCNATFSSCTLLENHFHQKHPTEEFYVLCCQHKWKQRFRLAEHVRRCHSTGITKIKSKTRTKRKELDGFIAQYKPSLKCVECGKIRTNFTALKEHFRQEHPTEECYILCCERKFVIRSHLAEHIRYHVDPNAFKCEVCDRCFMGATSLRSHMVYCHNNSRDISPLGGNSIEKSDALIAQWRTNLECVVCNESCTSFGQLLGHFRQWHSNEECHILCCQRTLKTRQQIEEHALFHIDSNAFKCGKCNKPHTCKANLTSHMRYRHGKGNRVEDPDYKRTERKRKTFTEFDEIIAKWMPNLECVICAETCSSFTLLRNHFRSKHPDEKSYVVCCGRKFIHRYQIEEHVRFHMDSDSFKCELCGKCYTSKFNLFKHMVTYHPLANIGNGPT